MSERLPDGKASETYQMPADGWVCFHCGVRFKKIGEAQEHFGETPATAAALKARVAELEAELITAYRAHPDYPWPLGEGYGQRHSE